MTQLGDHLDGIVVPGPFLELESQPRQLFLEDPALWTLSVNDGPARAVDEEQDRARLRAQVLAQIAAGSEPGDRVGPAQDDRVVTGGIEKRDRFAVLLLDVGSATGEFRG